MCLCGARHWTLSKSNQESEVIINNHTRITQWGINIVALWSLTLAFLAFANHLHITSRVQSTVVEVGVLQSWMVFGLNLSLLVLFSVSAYGLFKRQQWGRILFLVTVSIWAISNFFALFSPAYLPNQNYTNQHLLLNAFRYVVALILPIWYLNLPQVKRAFRPSSANLKIEDSTTNDDID